MTTGRKETTNVIAGLYALSVGKSKMPAPKGWCWSKLLDIADLESGHTPSRERPEYWNGDVPWVGIKDGRKYHGRRIGSTLQTITEEGLANSSARWLPKNTVCLSRTASIGYVTVLDRPMATSQDFVNWICSEAIDPDFLMHLLIAEHDSLLRFGKGSTHRTIYFPEVKALHVCVPPLNEQRRIVGKIEALFERSRRARKALDAIPPLIEKLRQSILAAAFRGDLTADWRAQNPDVEPIEEMLSRINVHLRSAGRKASANTIEGRAALAVGLPSTKPPAGWSWIPLTQVARLESGHTPSREHPEYWDGDIPWIGIKDARIHHGGRIHDTEQHISEDGLANSSARLLPANTVCISRTASVGYSVIMDRPMATSQDFVNWICSDAILPDFLLYLFLAEGDHLLRFGKGTTHTTIYFPELKAFHVCLPSVAEQQEIVHRVREQLTLLDSLHRQIELIRAQAGLIDQSILAKAFRGELVPQDPDDEPASVLLERIRAARQNAPSPRRGNRARPAEPSPPPPTTPRARARPAPAAAPAGLAAHDPETIQDILYAALWGRGPMERDAAVRTVAEALRDHGLVQYKKLRADGALYADIHNALDTAARDGYLDRPSPGQVRAVEPNPREYTTDDWRMALLAALDRDAQPVDRQQVVARAAAWARDNMGLAFKRLRAGGVIESGIASAITSALRRGELERIDATRIRRRT